MHKNTTIFFTITLRMVIQF